MSGKDELGPKRTTKDPFPNKLPSGFKGAAGLVMPDYLTTSSTSVTLPSRLDLLGRQSFKLAAAAKPLNVANSVLGFAPNMEGPRFNCCRSSKSSNSSSCTCSSPTCQACFGCRAEQQLFVLPWIFSKAAARMNLFVRAIVVAIVVILVVGFFGGTTVNPGKAWVVGTSIATFVMFTLATFRRSPDGVMAFCRSMGAPEIEEYMFSYCWKVEPENVRTLAKAVWNTGVGVWIDVVKLCPGDEIRPMLRSTVAAVHRVVIFLCPEYCASPNCCVEAMEAAQTPSKLIFCIVRECDNSVNEWLDKEMVPQGAVVLHGFEQLIRRLDQELLRTDDQKMFDWWRKQKISGAGVPSHVVPSSSRYWSSIPRCSVWGRVFVPPKSLTVGPLYLSGDCRSYGSRFCPPWLLLLALFAVGWNVGDLYETMTDSHLVHHYIDYIWLSVISLCDLAPLLGMKNLIDTRRDAHVALKPLMASKSLNGGVKVRIVGGINDAVASSLYHFIHSLHHHPVLQHSSSSSSSSSSSEEEFNSSRGSSSSTSSSNSSSKGGNGSRVSVEGETVEMEAEPLMSVPQFVSEFNEGGRVRQVARDRVVTVFIMKTLEDRAALFGSDSHPFDKYSLFVWTGSGDPFAPDPAHEQVAGAIGKRMMRFLVLVASWDKQLLAENLFSSISVRVVDLLHDVADEQAPPAATAAAVPTPNTNTM